MTDVKCNDLPEIAPRMRGGVGYCDAECPQLRPGGGSLVAWSKCGVNDSYVYPCDPSTCPVWATRTVARLEAVEAQLAAWESQDAHEGMDCHLRTKRLEAVESWTEKIMTAIEEKIVDVPAYHTGLDPDAPGYGIGNLFADLFATYPGKQPTSRQKDGQ